MSEVVQFYFAIYSFGALVVGLAVWRSVRRVRRAPEPENTQSSPTRSKRKSTETFGWFVLGGWVLLLGFFWLAQELDWFHNLRAWLNAPVPTWLFLVGLCTFHAGISEIKKMISRSHEVLGEKVDLIQQQRRSLESIEQSMWNR